MKGIDKVHHPADYLFSYCEEIKELYGKGKFLSLSFLPELDNKIWGLKPKTMVIVAGRPSMGKSTLMLQMAYTFALQKRKVYFFSLEMTKEDCLGRLLCNYCNIHNYNLHTGNLKEHMGRIAEFHEKIKNLKLVIIEAYGKNFGEILSIMDSFQKPDIVFIDYVNMIRQGKLSKKDAIDEYIKDVRNLALDRNFCVVLGAQINRDVHRQTQSTSRDEKEKEVPVPNMWNLKETGNLEEHSDLILIVHWPHYYRYLQEGQIDANEKDYVIKVAKNRNGRTGTVIGSFLPQFYRISNLEETSKVANRGID